jgi:hypothetical protein
VVEGARLESVYRCKPIRSSNLLLSAKDPLKACLEIHFRGTFSLVPLALTRL